MPRVPGRGPLSVVRCGRRKILGAARLATLPEDDGDAGVSPRQESPQPRLRRASRIPRCRESTSKTHRRSSDYGPSFANDGRSPPSPSGGLNGDTGPRKATAKLVALRRRCFLRPVAVMGNGKLSDGRDGSWSVVRGRWPGPGRGKSDPKKHAQAAKPCNGRRTADNGQFARTSNRHHLSI